MTITAKKGKGSKMHLYNDGEYFLTVTADFWFSGAIRPGDEIGEEALNAYIEKAILNKAYNKAFDLISRRDYCRKELEEKLSKIVDKEPARCAAQKVVDLGFVNDNLYAKKLAEELNRRKGFSRSRIKMELIHKGISREIVDQTMESIDIDPCARIIELLETKYSNRFSDEKNKARTFNALLRLGYSYADIRSAMRQLGIEISNE